MCSTCAGMCMLQAWWLQGHLWCQSVVWGEVRRLLPLVLHKRCFRGVNGIYLELLSEHLFRMVRSRGNAAALKPQLTKSDLPTSLWLWSCHCPRIGLLWWYTVDWSPVRVLPRMVWEDFLEPSVQACDVSVYLPALKTLKSTIERIANLGDQVLVEENLNGNVNLGVQTDVVSIKSYFNNFGNPPKSSQDMPQDRNLENMVQVLVKSRKLLQFFEGQQINPTTVLCSVLSNTLYRVFSSWRCVSSVFYSCLIKIQAACILFFFFL